MKNWWLSQKKVSGLLIVLAGLGLIASLALGYETLELIKNPNYTPSCNINPILSCANVMASPYSEIFGIPNPVFGIMGFTALLTLAVVLFLGVKVPRSLWVLIGSAAGGGLIWVHYLFYVSMAEIGSICPWCSLLWVSTIAIFWAITTYMAANKMCDYNAWTSKLAKFWVKYASPILISWYLVLIIIIFIRFREAWLALI